MPDGEFQPERMLETFGRHGVRFVLIGGFAAVIHGSPYVTTDLDVVPQRDRRNLERLSAALDEMHARVWTDGEPEGISFDTHPSALAGSRVWNLVTDFGRVDLAFEPSGTTGYDDLARDAVRLTILGSDVDVASLADVVRSKEAAGREKDRVVLPVLRRILAESP